MPRQPSRRTVLIVLGTLLVMTLAWQHVQATRLGYETERARRRLQSLRGRAGALQVELETAISPARLAAEAQRLGLIPASPERLRVLSQHT